ncbi:MAG: XisH family protein [Desulfobacterales bacterium]|nr:XisH family protein [Desulfobacterales bacterium]
MSAKDVYHEHVKQALIKDGWIITHDPFKIEYGPKVLYADLGAEQIFAAVKYERKIVVEVKSFIGASIVADLEQALGQYILYADVLSDIEPERIVYLAIREEIFTTLFSEPSGQILLRKNRVNLLVFDPSEKEILQWIP